MIQALVENLQLKVVTDDVNFEIDVTDAILAIPVNSTITVSRQFGKKQGRDVELI